MLKGWCTQLAL